MSTCPGCDGEGSAQGYWRGCRERACRDAKNVYDRDRMRRKNRPDAVESAATLSAGQVRVHLEELRAAGLGVGVIAQRSGIDARRVKAILSGEQGRVRQHTRERLLAVMPSQLGPGVLVPTTDAVEQLEALVSVGWSGRALAREVYGEHTKSNRVDLRGLARKRTVDRIAELYGAEFAEPPGQERDPLAAWRLLLEGDQSWRQSAECRRLDGDVKARQRPFFPERGVDVDFARGLCHRCVAVEPCLDFALLTRSQGVWGATTGEERREIRHQDLTAAQVVAMMEPGRPLMDVLTAAAKVA